MSIPDLPARFAKGRDALLALSSHPRYQAVFIFGSVAEGTSTAKSDLDAKVIVADDNPCENINHPTFDDYRLDLTFRSFAQIRAFTEEEIRKGEREPNLVRAVILFDKTGELTELQKQTRNAKPQRYTERDFPLLRFLLYHANNKVERDLADNPLSSLYSMHANIGDVLKMHFRLNGRWWVSSKKVLNSLDEWDRALADEVRAFVSAPDVETKFQRWSAIIRHVAQPMGGLQPISENNCDCPVCAFDLAALRDATEI